MAAATAIAIAAGLMTAYTVNESRQARKDAKKEMGRQADQARRAEAAQADKEKILDEQNRQRKNRERQRAMMAAKSGGRQSTILGGAGDVGNAGNQAQSGAGKTLLGV